MSTSSTAPACPAPGSISSPGLSAPKVTVTSALTAGPSTAPVSASMPLGRSTATTVAPACRACSARAARPANGSRRPPRPPMPSRPSTIRSAPVMSGAIRPAGVPGVIGHPAARLAQRGGAAGVNPGSGRDRGNGRAAAGQPGAGVERVAAVVPAAGQHDHAGAVHVSRLPAQQGGADRGEPGGGPAHQRPFRDDLHQRVLGGPDGGDLVGVSHGFPTPGPTARPAPAGPPRRAAR